MDIGWTDPAGMRSYSRSTFWVDCHWFVRLVMGGNRENILTSYPHSEYLKSLKDMS